MAVGRTTADAKTFSLQAVRGSETNGIVSNPFLEYAFKTESYTITVSRNADGTWSYEQDTVLIIPGEAEPFHHTDRNTLRKIGEPALNPRHWRQQGNRETRLEVSAQPDRPIRAGRHAGLCERLRRSRGDWSWGRLPRHGWPGGVADLGLFSLQARTAGSRCRRSVDEPRGRRRRVAGACPGCAFRVGSSARCLHLYLQCDLGRRLSHYSSVLNALDWAYVLRDLHASPLWAWRIASGLTGLWLYRRALQVIAPQLPSRVPLLIAYGSAGAIAALSVVISRIFSAQALSWALQESLVASVGLLFVAFAPRRSQSSDAAVTAAPWPAWLVLAGVPIILVFLLSQGRGFGTQ